MKKYALATLAVLLVGVSTTSAETVSTQTSSACINVAPNEDWNPLAHRIIAERGGDQGKVDAVALYLANSQGVDLSTPAVARQHVCYSPDVVSSLLTDTAPAPSSSTAMPAESTSTTSPASTASTTTLQPSTTTTALPAATTTVRATTTAPPTTAPVAAYTSSAATTRDSVVHITANVASTTSTQHIVSVGLYDGTRLLKQWYWENQTFNGALRTYTADWQPTVSGTLIVKIGVFSPGWAQMEHWNNLAATVPATTATATTVATTSTTAGTTIAPATTAPATTTAAPTTTTKPTASLGFPTTQNGKLIGPDGKQIIFTGVWGLSKPANGVENYGKFLTDHLDVVGTYGWNLVNLMMLSGPSVTGAALTPYIDGLIADIHKVRAMYPNVYVRYSMYGWNNEPNKNPTWEQLVADKRTMTVLNAVIDKFKNDPYVVLYHTDEPWRWLSTNADWDNWHNHNVKMVQYARNRGWKGLISVSPGSWNQQIEPVMNTTRFETLINAAGPGVFFGWHNYGVAGTSTANLNAWAQKFLDKKIPLQMTANGAHWNRSAEGTGVDGLNYTYLRVAADWQFTNGALSKEQGFSWWLDGSFGGDYVLSLRQNGKSSWETASPAAWSLTNMLTLKAQMDKWRAARPVILTP